MRMMDAQAAARHSAPEMAHEHEDEEAKWAAVLARDRRQDGAFVTGVLTTGIYCRPSCPARHPRRSSVRFFPTGEAARAAGLRPCLRCRPDEASRDKLAIESALKRLEAAEETPRLADLAQETGYSPFHFHRLFRRATGTTPAAWHRALRARRALEALGREKRITDAVYAAGYSGPARFYADSADRLGMTPSAWRAGGRGVTISWARADSDFGPLLVAATERGICRLAFEEDEASLRRLFPAAEIRPAGPDMAALVRRVVAAVEAPERPHDLPLDVRGTAFQEAVWKALSRIPPGETLSYAALAAAAGRPGAVRAAGSACGANKVAVLIPCHRARRTDGSPGGYAWGLERKARLVERERRASRGPDRP